MIVVFKLVSVTLHAFFLKMPYFWQMPLPPKYSRIETRVHHPNGQVQQNLSPSIIAGVGISIWF